MASESDRQKIIDYRNALVNAFNAVYSQHTKFQDIISNLVGDYKEDYLTFSLDDPTQISYAESSEFRYTRKRRRRTRLGRYVRRHFKQQFEQREITDKELDTFVNDVLRNSPRLEALFELLEGEDIVKAYDECVGQSSCMTGGNDAVHMLANNENVRLMVYRHTNSARALLWNTDDGQTVLDRIYPNDGAHVGIMREYCTQRDWIYRISASLPEGDVQLSDNSRHTVTMESNNDLWPYMDTFRWAQGHSGKATLSNHRTKLARVTCCLDSTSGHFADNRVNCCVCNERWDSSEMTQVDNGHACENCIEENFAWSSIEGRHINRDAAIPLNDRDDSVSEWYANTYCCRCDVCLDYYYHVASLTSQNGTDYCENCLPEPEPESESTPESE